MAQSSSSNMVPSSSSSPPSPSSSSSSSSSSIPSGPPYAPRYVIRHMNCDAYPTDAPSSPPCCPPDDGGPSARALMADCLRGLPPAAPPGALVVVTPTQDAVHDAVANLAGAHFLRGHPDCGHHAIRMLDATVVHSSGGLGMVEPVPEGESDGSGFGPAGHFMVTLDDLRGVRARGFVEHVEVRYWTWDEWGTIGHGLFFPLRGPGGGEERMSNTDRYDNVFELHGVLGELNGLARRSRGSLRERAGRLGRARR
ncbi:hypothetical protein GGR56DRAFT_681764 [Xylariaceae sp. FL0804]|nr:hypothetical protein GGR56DRAFT_681764 [Xylariaceae sp. FL0804]